MSRKLSSWLITSFIFIDILILAHIFLIRPWYMHWGANETEAHMPLPGDSIIPQTAEVSTRAITIQASSRRVWQWLVQIGQGRGGFYSYDWLENIFAADMHNASRILPEFQHLAIGDRVALASYGGAASHLAVVQVEPERLLVLERGWIFYLQPINLAVQRALVMSEAYLFWLGFPGLIYLVMGGLASWRLNYQLHP